MESLKIVTQRRYDDHIERFERTIYYPLAQCFPFIKHLSFRRLNSSDQLSLAIIEPFITRCHRLETIIAENLIDPGDFLQDIGHHLTHLKFLAMLNEKVSLLLAKHIIEEMNFIHPVTFAILSQEAVYVTHKSQIPEVTAMIEDYFQDEIVCPKFRPIYTYTRSEEHLEWDYC